jgi:hypothetical protein
MQLSIQHGGIALRSRRPVALVVVLVWFYVFLAAVMNPSYTPPTIPNNPIMPFLAADTVGLLWPLVLVSFLFVMLAAQQLIRSTGRTRQVSPRDFARVQARAHVARERIREDVRQSGSRASKTPQGKTASTEGAELTSTSTKTEQKLVAAEELLRPVPKASESEFTPPPMIERQGQFPDRRGGAGAGEGTAKESLSDQLGELSMEGKDADASKRIEELEAERAAMASLMDRLEDMHKMGAIQPELYDKLKKKYVDELEKINAKVERLPVNEELKKKALKKATQI